MQGGHKIGHTFQGADLSGYSQAQRNRVSLRLNQRPRKTLGFQTPTRLEANVASTAWASANRTLLCNQVESTSAIKPG